MYLYTFPIGIPPDRDVFVLFEPQCKQKSSCLLNLLCKAFFPIKQWKNRKSDVLNFKGIMLKTASTPPHIFRFYKQDLPSVHSRMTTIHTNINYQLSDMCWVQTFMSLFQIFTLLFDLPVKPQYLEGDVFATTLKQDNNQLHDSQLSDKDTSKKNAETKCSRLRKN